MFTNKVKALNVRGLDESIFMQLQSLAAQKERSLEGEARYAIHQWCKAHQQSDIENNKFEQAIKDTARRLNIAFDNINELNLAPISHTQLAEKMNLSQQTIYQWFEGQSEIPFFQLDILAKLFGCNSEWLKHGSEEPYCAYSYNIAKQHPMLFAKEFLQSTLDGIPVSTLHIIFNEENGYVYIVQEFKKSNICYMYRSSSFYLKGEYGSNGLDNAARFVLMLLAFENFSSEVIIKGYKIQGKFTENIFKTCNQHPLFFLKYAEPSSWNEDIIDSDYPQSYWNGYKELQKKIHTHIKTDALLSKFKKDIKLVSSYWYD